MKKLTLLNVKNNDLMKNLMTVPKQHAAVLPLFIHRVLNSCNNNYTLKFNVCVCKSADGVFFCYFSISLVSCLVRKKNVAALEGVGEGGSINNFWSYLQPDILHLI